MTVQELIKELQKLPQQKTCCVVQSGFHIAGEFGDDFIPCDDSDAIESDEVQDIGHCVLIRSK